MTVQNKRRHWVEAEVVSLQCEELGMAPFPMTPWVTCRSLAEARHIIVNSGAHSTPLCACFLSVELLSVAPILVAHTQGWDGTFCYLCDHEGAHEIGLCLVY